MPAMNIIFDIIQKVFAVFLSLGFLILVIYVLKKRFIDKKQITMGTQFVGENLLMQYQAEDKKNASEHVIYMRDEEEIEDEDGDDLSRFPKFDKGKRNDNNTKK